MRHALEEEDPDRSLIAAAVVVADGAGGEIDDSVAIDVTTASPKWPDGKRTPPKKVQKCLELFEDFCVVTASVRVGLPVGVRVEDARGRPLYERAG